MRAVATAPVLLAVVAAVVRLPTFLSSRTLSFDDGVYGASVVDMRRGLVPYRDLFSSQGPLHLPLLYAGDVLGLHTIDAPRLTPLVAGIVAAIRGLGRRPPARGGGGAGGCGRSVGRDDGDDAVGDGPDHR